MSHDIYQKYLKWLAVDYETEQIAKSNGVERDMELAGMIRDCEESVAEHMAGDGGFERLWPGMDVTAPNPSPPPSNTAT